MEDIDDRPRAARHQVGRLEHHGIAVAERRRDLPGRDGDREVPRRDDADHAHRLARHLDADARTHRRHALTRKAQRLTGEELEDLSGAGDFADAFGERLALFAAQQLAEFGLAGEDLVGGLGQDFPALQDARMRPGRERRLGRRDGVERVLLGGAGIDPHHLVGVGRVDIVRPVSADPFAVDEILVQFGHGRFLASRCICTAFSTTSMSSRRRPGSISPPARQQAWVPALAGMTSSILTATRPWPGRAAAGCCHRSTAPPRWRGARCWTGCRATASRSTPRRRACG